MKFSKSSRDVFEVTNFAPGPGFYVGNELLKKDNTLR